MWFEYELDQRQNISLKRRMRFFFAAQRAYGALSSSIISVQRYLRQGRAAPAGLLLSAVRVGSEPSEG